MKKIIIIGGGIGGLCTAIALQQYGFDVKVYEKVRKLGEVGAGLTLWSNAIKVLRKLGVTDAVINAGSKLQRSQIRADNGETLFDARADELESKYGEPAVAIHRADLHEILINALEPNMLRLDMNCARFEQNENKVTVHFENGESDSANVLVGGDGIHSVIRKQMFPEVQLRYSGYTAWEMEEQPQPKHLDTKRYCELLDRAMRTVLVPGAYHPRIGSWVQIPMNFSC